MNDDILPTNDPRTRLDQLRRRKEDGQEILTLDEEEDELEPAEDDGRCYSIVSADRMRKLALELRYLTGDGKALAYSYLVSIDWSPSEGIKMDFSGNAVEIRGRNLRAIFDAAVAQRLAYVREMDDLQARANLPSGAPVVTKIKVTDLRQQSQD
jgi:hypothetical protein